MYKIIGADQKQYGPISVDQLRQWILEGRVTPQTQVLAGDEWKPAAEIPELAALFAPRPHATPAYAPAPGAPAPSAGRTSGMAVASLVLAVIPCGITSIVGLILGIVSLLKIKGSGGTLRGSGLALAGIIVSAFLLIFSVGFYAAILIPAFARAREKAMEIRCVNNEKRLARAVSLYAISHDDHLPSAASWCDDIKTSGAAEDAFKCPAADSTDRCDYAINSRLNGMKASEVPANTVLMFETDAGWNRSGGRELMLQQARHGGYYIVAFADGSVQILRSSQLDSLRWNP